ncbi:MAG: hypothetical protein ABFR90_12060 [Planctomycetota bacterium]
MKKKKIILKACFLFLSLLIIACSVYVYYCYQIVDRGGNLKALCTSFMCYAGDNNDTLPDAKQWSDLLIEGDWLYPEYFVDGKTRYAMNINASGMKINDLPNDMVLLFEAKGPKNLSGGPELIMAQKYRWPGCAVQSGYTVDQIKFVKKKDIEGLRWKP